MNRGEIIIFNPETVMRQKAREGQTLQIARINDVSLNFRLEGDAGRRPVIAFANSLGTDLRIWDGVAERLAGDYALLFHDKRGHGLSDVGALPRTMDQHVGDLAGLLDHLGIARAVICGISVGGLIAQGLWGTRPELLRGLILCDTAHRIGTAETWNARIDAVGAGRLEEIAEAVLDRWFTRAYREAEPAAYAVYRNMLVRTSAAGYAGTCEAIRDTDYTEIARSIGVPTLCVVGDADGSTPPEVVQGLADLVPGARLETIPGSGHLPCIDNPEILAGLIRGFMEDLA
jgi:3-oxoadipate enol-lactonase